MSNHSNQLGNNLLNILCDKSDEVVLKCISVLAEIVNSQHSKGNICKIELSQHLQRFINFI